MTNNTVYLITGAANRGIGQGLVTVLLQRPNTTVIATSRKPPTSTTPPVTPAQGSIYIPFALDDSTPALSTSTLASRLSADHGITHLNVVIANAGASAGFHDLAGTNPDDMAYDFAVNAIGPAKLFKAAWPLVEGNGEGEKKYVLISSAVGSIGGLLQENVTGLAYGMSKAAANYFAVKAAVEYREKGLLVGVLHPGWVQTDMGQDFADAAGYTGEIPTDIPSSAKGIVNVIDNLTPETSGHFVTFEGKPVPW